MHFGVELLYEHTRTTLGFLTKIIPTSRAKCTGKRSVWKIKPNDLAFWMNLSVMKFLNEILLGIRITKPDSIRRRRRRRRRRTTASDLILGRNRLFRCHKKVTKSREKERNKETQLKIRHMKEEKNEVQCMIMHEHVMCQRNCIMGKKTQSKLQHSHWSIKHTT